MTSRLQMMQVNRLVSSSTARRSCGQSVANQRPIAASDEPLQLVGDQPLWWRHQSAAAILAIRTEGTGQRKQRRGVAKWQWRWVDTAQFLQGNWMNSMALWRLMASIHSIYQGGRSHRIPAAPPQRPSLISHQRKTPTANSFAYHHLEDPPPHSVAFQSRPLNWKRSIQMQSRRLEIQLL